MAVINVTDRKGQKHTLQAAASGNLMETLRDNNVDVEAICGGCCSCATCHVFIGPAWAEKIPTRSGDEQELLTGSTAYRSEESRLSCQIQLTDALDGLEVTVAPAD